MPGTETKGTTAGDGARPRRGRHALLRRFLPLGLIVVGLVVAYAAGLDRYLSVASLGRHHQDLKIMVAEKPALYGVLFFVTYVAAVAVSFPAAFVLTIAAGFLFGAIVGGLLVAVAATIGATLLFLAAKTAFGTAISERAGPLVSRFAAGFRADGFSYLLILRLVPAFPFFLVNVAPAFFDMRTRTYVTATFLGILPGTFAFAFLGSGLESVLDRAAQAGRSLKPEDFVTPGLTLTLAALAVFAALPLVYRYWLRRNTAGGGRGAEGAE
ncbi:TVP38/TMEM64 family protein [Rhizobium sp. TRM95111]|uniref:TVP38/TMEM64 family protein n=1 Tax=Rhizobium alarense TaxID=2846851 RepID=UPI001F3B28D0|nr:TVP38/TMEM64 family protein [Rhizobium alarense]MCF3639152.1 TVP38/TMEM64 family protein [Rhizobium alarense]